VFGKQLGVSEVVMGSITAVLPILFLVAKPVFGLIVDYFQEQRKTVFMGLLCFMSLCYVLLYFIPQPDRKFITDKSFYHLSEIQCDQLDTCQSWVSIVQHFCLQQSKVLVLQLSHFFIMHPFAKSA
jgi:MFS family permease